MEIKTLSSGSHGNCYFISDGQTNILIEAGIRWKSIQKKLNFQTKLIHAALISHEHSDHSRCITDVMKAGINCFMSPGTAGALSLSGHRLKPVKPLEIFTVGTFKILPFYVQHDAAEPMGYLLQSKDGEKLLFATDTYYIRYLFKDINYYMIECNYSAEILEENIKAGSVPAAIRNRIVKSHFELENVKEFFRVNNTSKVKQIHLIHLSGSNADPKLFKAEIQAVTGKPVYIFGLEDLV